MVNKLRSACLFIAFASFPVCVAEVHGGTITGQVVHADGTSVTNEVTIQAWCATGKAILLDTVVTDRFGYFTVFVDGKSCPAANLTLQVHGTTSKITVANIATTKDVNLGRVSVPGSSSSVSGSPNCSTPGCEASCCQPSCHRGIFRRR